MDPDHDAGSPLLQIVKPDATPEEIAAIVAVLSALRPAPASSDRGHRSLWADPAHRLQVAHHHGDGAWRASGLPR